MIIAALVVGGVAYMALLALCCDPPQGRHARRRLPWGLR